MTNKEIAASFNLLAKLMELENENPFKIRSYQNAYGLLNKMGTPLSEMSEEEIKSLKGVGKAIAGKIGELLETGKMSTLERYKANVPDGIIEMLQIKGLGPKKIKLAWDQLGVENATELLYACNENRLIELSGFGKKTQHEVKKQLEFFLRNRSNFLYVNAEVISKAFLEVLSGLSSTTRVSMVGDLRRKEPILNKLEFLVSFSSDIQSELKGLEGIKVESSESEKILGTYQEIPFVIYKTNDESFARELFRLTGPESLVEPLPDENYQSEEDCFDVLKIPFIPPEARNLASEGSNPPSLIEANDIKGVIHTHTTWSDGVNSVMEMATYSQNRGYDYLGITDHSKIAVYANGVSEESLPLQWADIDKVNEELTDFKVLKGTECDILNDGTLDYDDETLGKFDFVISSVHTNIKMDEKKATDRIITAVEHPATNILGHPTGRLLLGRNGYPLDIRKVIEACAANKVAIELNASPYRLDLDWKWIRYAREKGVMISINPDAHAQEAIDYIGFGVIIARKGWLDREGCLNSLSADQFLEWCRK